jgi:hypothetical protein
MIQALECFAQRDPALDCRDRRAGAPELNPHGAKCLVIRGFCSRSLCLTGA